MSKFIKISRHIPSALQGTFNFAGGRSVSMTIEHPAERHVSRVLFVLVAILACAYLYFVCSSILNIIARKEAITQIDQLQNNISVLETQYFTLAQKVTPQQGESLGLTSLTTTSYVYRAGDTAVAADDNGQNI